MSTSKRIKVYFSPKREKCGEIARGQFLKITETAHLPGWEFEADKSRYGGYIHILVTRHWNWMNSYWIFWIGCLRGACCVSSFCDFLNMTFCDLTTLSSFLTQANLGVFRCSYQGVLKRNIINFDAVDFSECRPEEVISFFWHSV